jgi:hypothetical protein
MLILELSKYFCSIKGRIFISILIDLIYIYIFLINLFSFYIYCLYLLVFSLIFYLILIFVFILYIIFIFIYLLFIILINHYLFVKKTSLLKALYRFLNIMNYFICSSIKMTLSSSLLFLTSSLLPSFS